MTNRLSLFDGTPAGFPMNSQGGSAAKPLVTFGTHSQPQRGWPMRGTRVDELEFCVSANVAAHGTTPPALGSLWNVTGGLGTHGYSWRTTPWLAILEEFTLNGGGV